MKKLLSFVMMVIILFSVTACNKEENEKDEYIQESSYVQQETVEVLVAKFNTEIVENGILNPASNEYLTIYEDSYWYGLITGIYLIVYPLEYTGNLNDDIVDYMVLYVKKDSEYASDVNDYMEHLIKANNSDITVEEVAELIKKAKESALSGKTVNNCKGIDIGYIENEDNYQYHVIRLYE